MVVAVATPRDLIAALPRNLDDEGRHDRVRQFFASGAGARVKKATAFWRLWCIVELAAAVQAEVPVIVKMGVARRDALDVGLALHRLRQQSKVGAAAPTAIQLAEPGLEAMRRDIWSIHGADEPSPLDDVRRRVHDALLEAAKAEYDAEFHGDNESPPSDAAAAAHARAARRHAATLVRARADGRTFDVDGAVRTLNILGHADLEVERAECAVAADYKREMGAIKGGVGVEAVEQMVHGVLLGALAASQTRVLEVDAFVCGEPEALAALPADRALVAVKAASAGGRLGVLRVLLEEPLEGMEEEAAGDGSSSPSRAKLPFNLAAEEYPLKITASSGHAPCARLLLAHGADPNSVDVRGDGNTPLIMAAQGTASTKGIEVLTLLLDAGARVDTRDHRGMTALMCAAMTLNLGALRVLLDRGANIHHRSKNGFDALSFAVETIDRKTGWQQRVAVVAEFLLERGASARAQSDFSALHKAVVMCNVPLLKTLVAARGVDVDYVYTEDGHSCGSALCQAALPMDYSAVRADDNTDRLTMARLLLDAGASPNVRRDQGRGPLLIAAMNSENALCALLLERGADIHARDDQQLNALFFALMAGNFELIVWLMKRGAMSLSSQIPCPCAKAMHFHAQLQSETQLLHDDAAVAERIAALRAEVPSSDAERAALNARLAEFVQGGGAFQISSAVADGADPDAPCCRGGLLPLGFAAGKDDITSIKKLIAAGARIDARDAAGRTALAIAVVQAALSALRSLLAYGADPNVADKDGRTPLWRAAGGDNNVRTTHGGFSDPYAQIKAGLKHEGDDTETAAAIVKALLVAGAGAMIDATDARDGITALHRAVHSGNAAVARVLIASGANVDAQTLVPMVHAGVTCATSGVSPIVGVRYHQPRDADNACPACTFANEPTSPRCAMCGAPLVPAAGIDLCEAEYSKLDATARAPFVAIARPDVDGNTAVQTMLGTTPLWQAVCFGRARVARELLLAGADARASDAIGASCLYIAANKATSDECIELLLAAGADIEAPCGASTPLRIAAAKGRLAVVKRLLAEGAQIETPCSSGFTPLMAAINYRHDAVAEFLRQRGAMDPMRARVKPSEPKPEPEPEPAPEPGPEPGPPLAAALHAASPALHDPPANDPENDPSMAIVNKIIYR